MKSNIRKLASRVSALAIALVSAPSFAGAVAVSEIHFDWTSVSITTDSGLTLRPDPVAGGKYANTAHLGVSQGEVNGVTVPSEDLQPFNLSYQPVDTPLGIHYRLGNSIGSIAADIATDASSASLRSTASDDDGNPLNGNFINAYVTHSARSITSGNGTLGVSVSYTMDFTITGDTLVDVADAYGVVTLALQDYVINAQGGFDYQGSVQDSFNHRIYLADGSYAKRATLSLQLPVEGTAEHLVLLEMNGFAIPFANSFAPSPVPEPHAFQLALVGLGLLGFVARHRKP